MQEIFTLYSIPIYITKNTKFIFPEASSIISFMIADITGTVSFLDDSYIIIRVGGLGYKIYAPKETIANLSLDETATLATHLAVKEDALDLYGFSTTSEKNFFELLIGISGIGPKGALGILNLAPLKTLEESIASGDSAYLTKVSGIGKKTANKLVLELKDKIQITEGRDQEREIGSYQEETETLDALQGLGYTLKEARETLSQLPKNAKSSDEKIREALKILGKNN